MEYEYVLPNYKKVWTNLNETGAFERVFPEFEGAGRRMWIRLNEYWESLKESETNRNDEFWVKFKNNLSPMNDQISPNSPKLDECMSRMSLENPNDVWVSLIES